MRSRRILAGAVLAAAALAPSTTAAFAGGFANDLGDDFGAIESTPRTAEPGATVHLSTSACPVGGTATVNAGSLWMGNITLSAKAPAPAPAPARTRAWIASVQGSLKIPSGTDPGSYGIGGRCDDGKEITGIVRVGITSDGTTSGATTPRPAPESRARTGVGTTSQDANTTETAVGAAVLLTAAGGGAWALRRRGTGNRTVRTDRAVRTDRTESAKRAVSAGIARNTRNTRKAGRA